MHIYKTGGTSVKDLLEHNYEPGEIYDLYYSKEGSTGQQGEILKVHDYFQPDKRTKIAYGHFAYGIHQRVKRPYTYMCFLRHPKNRILSTYYNLKRLEPWWQLRVLRLLDKQIQEESDLQTHFPDIEQYFLYPGIQNQQCMFLTGKMPSEIARDQEGYANLAIEHMENDFSFIGLTEAFDASISILKSLLRLDSPDFNYRNRGINRPKTAKLSSDHEGILKENSKADYLIYEYAKKRFEQMQKTG